MNRIIPALCLTATFLAAADPPALRPRPVDWAQPVLGAKTGNLFKVSEDLYRCEQPDDDNLAELKALGIRSVLSLREFHSDEDDIRDPAIRLYRIPMSAGDMEPAKITAALDILRTAEKPILVHCWHGSDRTGAVVASYRMAIQGWQREAAIDEFKNGGFGYHETWYPNIETFLRTATFPRP
ncbi:MAG: tyrosine-protein phosphatase [Planctomycetes bacterium]|nr:tyrosine-protein phosphatase [Planctomycetota bacterium]